MGSYKMKATNDGTSDGTSDGTKPNNLTADDRNFASVNVTSARESNAGEDDDLQLSKAYPETYNESIRERITWLERELEESQQQRNEELRRHQLILETVSN